MSESSTPASTNHGRLITTAYQDWQPQHDNAGTQVYTALCNAGHQTNAFTKYLIWRQCIDFLTSFLGAFATLNNAKLRLYITSKPDRISSSAHRSCIVICKGNQSLPPITADYQGVLTGAECGIKHIDIGADLDGIILNAYNDFIITDYNTLIEKTGITKVMITSYPDRYDVNPNDESDTRRGIEFQTPAQANKPLLIINYTLPAIGNNGMILG
ncbi:hypothetical protein ES705_34273 [subsurface metagenome]